MQQGQTTTVLLSTPDRPAEVTEAVVRAVADAEEVSPLDLSPLTTAIDPDALEAIVGPHSSQGDDFREVRFTYSGYVVTVSCDENIAISLDDSASQTEMAH